MTYVKSFGNKKSEGCVYDFTDYRQPAFWVAAAAVVGIGAMIYTRKSK